MRKDIWHYWFIPALIWYHTGSRLVTTAVQGSESHLWHGELAGS